MFTKCFTEDGFTFYMEGDTEALVDLEISQYKKVIRNYTKLTKDEVKRKIRTFLKLHRKECSDKVYSYERL